MADDADLRFRAMIDVALRGEEMTIDSGSVPILSLVPVEKRKFTCGVLVDKLKGPVPDFSEPVTEDELLSWEDGDAQSR